eukprot:CAMPEP_0168353660 /NCGR_PEP_ID=MMETSP0213-20121227/23390_1 /TAXON_ID=151035 /ORGANISM="Euplotes harpa, Strain FSP1.4" /LENGTH=393 /DNA_ID=CAMNT_0008365327 /DNA_START=362 /DNA_END=1539 /DNA_ORIENTATION=+
MRSDLSMSSENHPYTQSQKIKYENNEYLAEISNWENIKTFILPNEFVNRKFDVILDHIDKEFKERGLRNVFYENQYEYSKIHKCRRYSECMCRVFVRDLLQIAYYKKTENVHKYLERYILKPQIYLPFSELMLWLQLEVTRKNLSQAEAIVKRYIANTTNLIDDETKGAVALDLKKKDGPKDPWKPKPENLTLKESEYYKLVELYLFDIVLPEKGYDEAKNLLIKEIAMDREKKTEYLEKLSDLYKNAIRETSLMHGTEAIKQLNKAKVKSDVSSQIDKIKAMPNQLVDSQVDPSELKSFVRVDFHEEQYGPEELKQRGARRAVVAIEVPEHLQAPGQPEDLCWDHALASHDLAVERRVPQDEEYQNHKVHLEACVRHQNELVLIKHVLDNVS